MRSVLVLTTFMVVLGLAGGAQAQDRDVQFYGLGPRIGFSLEPDQFVFGGHADFGDPFPHTTLLLPVIEIGVGNDATVTSIGSDLLFKFTNRWGAWNPYVGGELAFIITNVNLPGGGDDTNTDIGLSGIFGVEKGIGSVNRFGAEVKIGIVDTPDVKLIAHWTFGH